MKKSTIFISAVLLGVCAHGLVQAQWRLQATLSGNPPLYAVDAVNRDVAWIVGDAADDVYRTTNGGKTWAQRANVASGRFLTFIDALDSSTAFVTAFNPNGSAGIYRTTNGGQSWQLVYTPPRSDNNYWNWCRR